jgi:hypothetical protein
MELIQKSNLYVMFIVFQEDPKRFFLLHLDMMFCDLES